MAKFNDKSAFFLFSVNKSLFLQKCRFNIQIANIYLGLGFGFGPQRIKDLAIVFP